MSEPATVTVSASAERTIVPDAFRMSFEVQGRGSTAADAANVLVARFAALDEAVADLPASVTVTRGRIRNWPDGGKRPTWHASRSMTVDGDDIASVAEVLGAMSHVPEVEVDGPQWRVSQDNEVHAELQAAVVQRAQDRAGRYAEATGGTLGRLVRLADTGTGGGFAHAIPTGGSFAARRGAPPQAHYDELDLSPQPITMSATVEATW